MTDELTLAQAIAALEAEYMADECCDPIRLNACIEAVLTAYTRPQSDLTREGVARVIDPKAWEALARFFAWADEEEDGRRAEDMRTDARGLVRLSLAKADAILAMVPGGVPDGFKLVPVEPTEAMLDAVRFCYGDFTAAGSIYQVMLDAAPLPTAPKEGDPTP